MSSRSLPVTVKKTITDTFDQQIREASPVHGGDINDAYQCTLQNGQTVFAKYHNNAPHRMFTAEAKGLSLLREHAPEDVLIPEVLHHPDDDDDVLLLSWIATGSAGSSTYQHLGHGLATIHKTTDASFGLDHDNYIGRLPQSNTQHNSWSTFFIEERIRPQVQRAVDSGKLNSSELKATDRLSKRVDDIFPEEPPALIHGDLWGGNYMIDQNQRPVLIDPAVYYGHREMEIAFTKLFGGFPASFYDAYNEIYPLDSGFSERTRLCNLYPILVHTNLFGGHYAGQASRILSAY